VDIGDLELQKGQHGGDPIKRDAREIFYFAYKKKKTGTLWNPFNEEQGTRARGKKTMRRRTPGTRSLGRRRGRPPNSPRRPRRRRRKETTVHETQSALVKNGEKYAEV